LPHCPTWRETGQERASPRGRIAAMRAVQWGGAPADEAFEAMIDECVGCRGCEPPCPAFVPFGRLVEGARQALHADPPRRRPVRRIGEWIAYRLVLPRHRILLALTWLLWLLQRLHLWPRRGRFAVPPISARSLRRPLQPSAQPSGAEQVVLFTGCVMDAWMRDTHRAAVAVVEAAGGAVALPGRGADCCGALHAHAGRHDEAVTLARRVMAALPGDAPVLVDSAGCGAFMKEYGALLGTPEATAFSARVRDVHEWLGGRRLPVRPAGTPVVVQDPCHLRHVQRAHGAVHTLLAQVHDVREPADEGLCCGAGGAYSVFQPELSNALGERKAAALRQAGAGLVASANPGCLMQLRAHGVEAVHPVELLARALIRAEEGDR
ncbi:MAG TPA: (Fe-S)-binding protein, partial [Acidimicrobiia bacterium]|nr:(Fe-S)-binding protein [Acidimicrobiia bacterium]